MNDSILKKAFPKISQISFYRKTSLIIIFCIFLINYLLNGGILSMPYGSLIAGFSSFICNVFHCPVSVQQNMLVMSKVIMLINQKYLSLYWFFGLITLIILFSPDRKTLYKYAFLVFSLNVILNTARLVIIPIVLNNSNWSLYQTKPLVFALINSAYLIVLYKWFSESKSVIFAGFKEFNISDDIVILIIKILFAFIIIIKCIAPVLLILNFDGLIQGLLLSSKKILHLFGYYPEVFHRRIAGMDAGIRFAKQCLGIALMLVFSSFIYFTGKSIMRKILFIFSGIFIINLLNVFRFVFLYIYIAQGNQKITSEMVHDIYNLILYVFVFVMWMLWIEKFSDHETILKYLRRK